MKGVLTIALLYFFVNPLDHRCPTRGSRDTACRTCKRASAVWRSFRSDTTRLIEKNLKIEIIIL